MSLRRGSTAEGEQAASEADAAAAIQRFIATYAHVLAPPPPNLFSQLRTEHMGRMADAQANAIQRWVRAAPQGARTAIWETAVFPRMVLREYGRPLGFNLLRCSLPSWHQDLPTLIDDGGLYGTLSAFPTFAFLLQNELQRHTSPHIDLHVLCKGVHDFNRGLEMPTLEVGGRRHRLITYVHTEHNLSNYVAALLASKAFRDAACAPRTDAAHPLRRIVIPIQVPGHFFLFGWDRTLQHDLLFTVSTVPDRFFEVNKGACGDILREMRRQLFEAGLLLHGAPDLAMHEVPALYRMSMLPEFQDIACVFIGILSALFLGMVSDINSPALANPLAWHTFRAGYAAYEWRLLQLLEARANVPVLLGPEWGATFLNVRDARLLVAPSQNEEGGWSPLAYTWDDGWVAAAAAP